MGSLTAAVVVELLRRSSAPAHIEIVAYEVDPLLASYLARTLLQCAEFAREQGTKLGWEIRQTDFIHSAVDQLRNTLFAEASSSEFDCVVTNPPYRKLASASLERKLLDSIGASTSNLYTAFLSLSTRLLRKGGQLVAITPRSFCNGTYFRPFREEFLARMGLRRVHLFDSRTSAFSEDAVLQENIVFHAERGHVSRTVEVTTTTADSEDETRRVLSYSEVVLDSDPERFIRLPTDELASQVAKQMGELSCSLGDLGLRVSTGRVVDFRVREHLRENATHGTVPLIQPGHFRHSQIGWPRVFRKPNAVVDCEATRDALIPNGTYVLVKRFSSKEEKRRVVAALLDRSMAEGEHIGLENHLNYFHSNGRELERPLALGLLAFLNSTILDEYFRQLSGHTQVNAGDLRSLKYPSHKQLMVLGARVASIGLASLDQHVVDSLVAKVLFKMATNKKSLNPARVKARIAEAKQLLSDVGMPKAQQNERTALVLLSLLDLRPEHEWSDAQDPLQGVTPMMDFFKEHYGKSYAPNSRETVRRRSIHQLLDAGLIAQNPDDPARPVNSDKTVYQVAPDFLRLLKSVGSKHWRSKLGAFTDKLGFLAAKYAKKREMQLVPVRLPSGKTIKLSPGGQNPLVARIVEEFCPRFTPGGHVLYIGDALSKFTHFEKGALADLGVELDDHGKMPDVIVHHRSKGWLVLIEAVASHGPVDAKRRAELQRLFKRSSAGLVFVSAFVDRRSMVKHLSEISWETEAWVADAPTHLIHFNGERFLGPYEE